MLHVSISAQSLYHAISMSRDQRCPSLEVVRGWRCRHGCFCLCNWQRGVAKAGETQPRPQSDRQFWVGGVRYCRWQRGFAAAYEILSGQQLDLT